MTFKLTRGETFQLAVEAFEIVGDASLVGAVCDADLVRALDLGLAPPPDTPPLAVFEVSSLVSEVAPGGGPGWILSLDPSETLPLHVGTHIERIRVTLANGFVEKLDPYRVAVGNG